MSIDEIYINDLYSTLIKLKTVEECKQFINDLCTPKEIEQMAQRIAAAKCLMQGDTYETVIKKTEISSATLSRVSRAVKYGEGYKKVLKNEG